MIQVNFTPRSRSLLERVELAPGLAASVVRDWQLGFADSRGTRLVACRWLSDDMAVLVDSEVAKAGLPGEHWRSRIEEVVVQAAIPLRPELPAGVLHRDMDWDDILAVVAESFGYPLTCNPDEPVSTLYSGPGSRETVVVHTGCIPGEFWLLGSYDPAAAHCELVWAFRPDRYWSWCESGQ